MKIQFQSSPIKDCRVKLLKSYCTSDGYHFREGDKVMPAERCDVSGIIGLRNPISGGVVQFTRSEWM